MRALFVLLLAALCGCKSGAGGVSGEIDFPGSTPGSSPVTLSVRSGDGFSCFIFGRSLFCEGLSTNADLGIDSLSFEPYVTDSDSNLTGLLVRDDTVCVTSSVLTRPYSSTPGTATYCIGEATLQSAPGGHPVIYGGPLFSLASYGTPDLTFSFAEEPFVGSDLTLEIFVASNFLTDGTTRAAVNEIDCEITADLSRLICPNFEVNL